MIDKPLEKSEKDKYPLPDVEKYIEAFNILLQKYSELESLSGPPTSGEESVDVKSKEKQIKEWHADLLLSVISKLDVSALEQVIKIEKNRGVEGSYSQKNDHSFRLPVNDTFSLAFAVHYYDPESHFSVYHDVDSYSIQVTIEDKPEKKLLGKRELFGVLPRYSDGWFSVRINSETGDVISDISDLEDKADPQKLMNFLDKDQTEQVTTKLSQLMKELLKLKDIQL